MKLIYVFNFKEKMSLWLGNSGHGFSLSSLSSPLPLLLQSSTLGWGDKAIVLICFFVYHWWLNIRNIFFFPEVDIHQDHFQRYTSKRGCVGRIQERMHYAFLKNHYYLLTFYSRTAVDDWQNNSYPIINYSWKKINSYSMFLLCSGEEGCIDRLYSWGPLHRP